MLRKQTHFVFLFLVIFFYSFSISAQSSQRQLQEKIVSIAKGYQATVGVSANNFNGTENFGVNGDEHFAMQSVYKFHLALAILAQIDSGKLKLEQTVTLKKGNIDKETHSPMRDAHPDQDIKITIKELLRYSVSLSDNNACDVLFELAGGPKAVNDYIRSIHHSKGVKDVFIAATEGEMKKDWSVQFTNWSTPRAATALLRWYHHVELISKENCNYLWELMTASVKTDRLKGQLPAQTIVAHKAGTSGKNKEGVRAAFNDIGIVMLPNGSPFYISVFINNSRESDEVNAKIIADITKLCYDYFGKQ